MTAGARIVTALQRALRPFFRQRFTAF